MTRKHLQNITKNLKSIYHALKPTQCPIFDNELVYFNRHGLKHLIRKGRLFRVDDELLRRTTLLKFCEEIIKDTRVIKTYNKTREKNSTAHFWELEKTINSNGITFQVSVIIRRLNNGKLHFFSIFDSKQKPSV